MQQHIDQDMCDCILSRDEDTYKNCTNGLTERDILCLEEECKFYEIYGTVGLLRLDLGSYERN